MSVWLQEEMAKIEKRRRQPDSGHMAPLVFFRVKSMFTKHKPKLSFAVDCIEKLHMTEEELLQFDAEMMADPVAFIKNGRDFNSTIAFTEHYLKAAFLYRGEIDYGIFRLSDLTLAVSETSKSGVIIRPTGRIFDVVLYGGKDERVGGVSMANEKDFLEFKEALQKYAPHVRFETLTKGGNKK